MKPELCKSTKNVVRKVVKLSVSDTDVRQCLLFLEKWLELILGWRQIVLGLVVDTNRLTVGICNDYLKQVHELLKCKWHAIRNFL